jgi:cyclase
MVKTRLIPVLYIKNGLIVRSEDFNYHQNIGNVINEASRYNEWNIDELLYIDISREKFYDLRRDDHKIKSVDSIEEVIKQISKVCFMPLTFGGGIRTLSDIELRIRNGADKITLNTGAYENPDLIRQGAEKFGAQCICISIDYKMIDGAPLVFTNGGELNTGTTLWDWIKESEKMGAGEFFINSIERDGKGNGYDINIIAEAVDRSRLPVIACGGAGTFYDFVDLAKETNVSGIAAGNIFHFTERSYARAKELLKKNNVNVR